MGKPNKWQPMQKAVALPASRALIAETMRVYEVDEAEALRMLEAYEETCQLWLNDIYQVQTREIGDNAVHINIRRRDGAAIMRDWRHFQQIKNELLGPECEAVELYPAESRKVDESNKYHLFGFRNGYRFPVGMEERSVDYSERPPDAGMRQRGRTMVFPGTDEGV